MVKNDMQMQVLQMIYNELCGLEHMPKRWRDDDKNDDSIFSIRRKCGRGTIDKGAAEHFHWLDGEYDYCERTYDCYTCVYECEKFDELSIQVSNIQEKYQTQFPTSEIDLDVDGHKDMFYLRVDFKLSDEDFDNQMIKLNKKKENKNKKEDGGIVMSDKGKEILGWLQEQARQAYSAREIAEGLFCNSRSIPGAMKKLVADGLVEAEKVGSAPYQYKITDAGAKLDLNEA